MTQWPQPDSPSRTQPHPGSPSPSLTVHWTDHRCLLESSQTISKPPTHSDVLLLLSLTPLYPLLPLFFFFARPPSTCLLVVSEASSPPPHTPLLLRKSTQSTACPFGHPLAPSATEQTSPPRSEFRARPTRLHNCITADRNLYCGICAT